MSSEDETAGAEHYFVQSSTPADLPDVAPRLCASIYGIEVTDAMASLIYRNKGSIQTSCYFG